MDIAALFLPVLSGLVGYLIRHADIFGQGNPRPAPTAAPVIANHPVLTELARLVAQLLAQNSTVVSQPSTPTVPPAQS